MCNNKKYILLSYQINEQTPLYGDTPPVRIKKQKEIKRGDSCNSSVLCLSSHSGTHIDVPFHFDNEGKKLCDFNIDELVFRKPLLIDCPKDLNELLMTRDLEMHRGELGSCDLLLLRTGFGLKRHLKAYYLNNPGIAAETAIWLRTNFPNIKAIGVDLISISSINNRDEGKLAHLRFLEKKESDNSPILLIEDIDLSVIDKNINMKRIFVVPLYVDGLEAAPCTVFAEI